MGIAVQDLVAVHQENPALKVRQSPQLLWLTQQLGMATQVFERAHHDCSKGHVQLLQLS